MSDIGRADREAREARDYDSPPYRVLVRRDYDLGADARETELNMIAELEGLGISPIAGTKEEFRVSRAFTPGGFEKAIRIEIRWAS